MTNDADGPLVFNEEDLLRTFDGDEGLVCMVAELFLDDARAEMERLKEAFDRCDMAALGRQAHKMKGAAANARAEAFSLALAAIEDTSTRGELTDAAPLIAAAGLEFERFRDFFKKTHRPGIRRSAGQ